MKIETTQVADMVAIKQSVDSLFSIAAGRFPTYETVMHRAFCGSMRKAFPNQASEEGAYAFKYAKEHYGYLTDEEIAEEDARNFDEGICSHGLDFWTCPCGCFE
ncbi:Uncharacterised protein [Pseudomonas luteola]|uniref:Uncharacterized protein n=1 Tax=Pseudomonas luteola TaxID=47886 RepID=A0A2X2C9Y0_PSELU|nr:hypothetical protein [Pseudomonas luteola]SPZ02546.1 Uncharacterised protein [Pseudomonas luteola]